MKKIYLIILVLISILSLSAVCASENATDAQDTSLKIDEIEINKDISTDKTIENKTFGDIQNLISASEDGDTIELEGTYAGNGDSIYNEKSLTIIGINEGATLDAKNLSTIIHNSGNITLKNINFINANRPYYEGGAIYNMGNLTITDCSFISNYAYNGGAIENLGTLSVNNSIFLKNNANTIGSAIYSRGNVTIVNSIFKDNSYDHSLIYVGDAFASIDNITVSHNRYSWYYHSALTFENCNLSLSNSKIHNSLRSHQCNGSLDNCYFEDTLLYPDINIRNATFKNCSIEYSKENGDVTGSIFDNTPINIKYENVSLRNSQFKNSISSAILLDCHSVNIINCEFENLTDAIEYPQIVNFKHELNIINSTFENISKRIVEITMGYPHPESKINIENCKVNNSGKPLVIYANNTKIINCEFANIKDTALYLYGDNQYIKNCSFENIGTGISIIKYEITTPFKNASIENSNFKQCTNAIEVNVNNLLVLNCNFNSNPKTAIYNEGASTNITNCSFLNSDKFAINLPYEKSHKSKNIIDNCRFINITNTDYSVVEIGSLNYTLINNSVFINNIGKKGVLNVYQPLNKLEIYNTQFINNTGLERGGAVYAGSITKVINCLFKQNKAPTGSSICFEFAKDGTAIENTQFIDNVAENGRDVSGYCEMKVTRTEFYYGDTVLKITYADKMTNKPMSDAQIKTYITKMEKTMFTNQNEFYQFVNAIHKTSNDGSMTVKLSSLKVGTYNFYLTDEDSLVNSELQITVKKAPTKLVASKLTTAYDPNGYYIVKVINSKTQKAIPNLKVTVTVSGKKITATTDKNGQAKFSLSKFALGLNKLQISVSDSNANSAKATSILKLNKAKTIITAPKVTAKYKKSAYFKVTVKTTSKKLVKNTNIKVKIDSKTYNVKTNSKGIAQVNTKSLKIGTHKVTISSGDSRLTMSKKSTIVIKK